MAVEIKRDPDLEWLDHVQPVGVVVAPIVLKDLGLAPSRQTQADTAAVAEQLDEDSSRPGFRDPWTLFQRVLGWEVRHVAGSPGGPNLPEELSIRLPEHDTTLSPTWAVAELGGCDRRWQLLVRIERPGIDPDARATLAGWEATAHQRFERLLRETGIHAGLLVTEKNDRKDEEDRYWPELRLIYAPRGETSGHLTFPLRALATVAGRPMLGGLKLLLDSVRLFTDADDRRLPALLKRSRDAQASVSTALAEQVLGALHELLRGLDAAEPKLIRELARTCPGHLYEGLLTVLMRLVFVLYAEDRDLLPSRVDGRARKIYESSYSARGLYATLVEDAALNPDTMDERRGAWGRLLALFRLIHKGHSSHFVQARGGKLFDPDQFPFLEGRVDAIQPPSVLLVSDGCVLRILEGLMTLKNGGSRERLSYRALDVEQIGSVYETVMGFTVENAVGRSLAIKAGKHNRTPVFVDLEKLAAAKGKDRIKFLKEEADRAQLSANVGKAVEAAKTAADLAVALDPIVDERGSPKKHEVTEGTPLLQPTDERRRTGSHYTPRSLTEPIVRYALEPTFERLGPEATPERILDLKVCDPAMGSGAFLVEACRAIAARLVEAWARHPDKKPVIPADEDEELHARRLVAQRCLYGVDKNPLATDLAKLSLWLATLARDHEFTFLDHALKSGDSLVGLTQAQIAAGHWDASKPGLPLFRQLVKDRVSESMKGRAEIQVAPDDTARAIQEQRHKSLEARLKEIRLIGDAVIAAFFAEDKPKAREKKRADVESWLGGSPVAWGNLAAITATLNQGAHPLTPFHWEIEFPEVFARENGGFDAVVGNPPFLGGKHISTALGKKYKNYLQIAQAAISGNADLCARFFRRAFDLIRQAGSVGLIATNTIAQGDTRRGGLKWICEHGGEIYTCRKRYVWPAAVAVVVSIVHFIKGTYGGNRYIDGRSVERISAYLFHAGGDSDPAKLKHNQDFAFIGCDIKGQGFLFDDADPEATPLQEYRTLVCDPKNRTILMPYMSGEEINESPTHAHRRFVINFGDRDLEAAKQWPELLAIVSEKVHSERKTKSKELAEWPWWRFWRSRAQLYQAISGRSHAYALSRVNSWVSVARVRTDVVYSEAVVIFARDDFGTFGLLQSRAHEMWARFLSSTALELLRYSPSNCFETFPFPPCLEVPPTLEIVGRTYHDHRAALMVARNEGMTKTYNRFHDPSETAEDIQRLRELHGAMDRAVLEAYGWHDLAARAAPIFLDETNEDDHTYQDRRFWPSDFRDEVLARLLALNAERHAEEVRLGIAPGMKGRTEADDDEEELEDD
ncbi:MAG: Eco57I restriction-modification methylase domain-containing protein [Steroidobacteraceae bacterium]